MLTRKQEARHKRTKSTLRGSCDSEALSQTIDLKSYRGNLYKQTLSPDWSKRRLKAAQKKYSNIAEDVRSSIDSQYAKVRKS